LTKESIPKKSSAESSQSNIKGQQSDVAKHIPVLLNEVLKIIDPIPDKFIIDGTANGGGHLAAIMERMEFRGTILAVEWDRSVFERTRDRFNSEFKIQNSKLEIHWANENYANIPEILQREKLGKADGLLLDLGFSSEQLESGKGFSFKTIEKGDEPLDMRYDRRHGRLTAAEAINSLREEELADIIFKYGEERFSRYIAKGIVEARKVDRIIAVKDLVEVIRKAVPKFFKKGEADIIARTFQALRIYINDELGNVERILRNLPEVMNKGGIIAIISFHSLEDRLVKNHFKKLEEDGIARILTKKPITPAEEEIKGNPASRSAKLRAIRIN